MCIRGIIYINRRSGKVRRQNVFNDKGGGEFKVFR